MLLGTMHRVVYSHEPTSGGEARLNLTLYHSRMVTLRSLVDEHIARCWAREKGGGDGAMYVWDTLEYRRYHVISIR